MKFTARFKLTSLLVAVTAAILPSSLLAISDAEANAGRTLVKQKSESIVGVEMVVTVKLSRNGAPMPPRENKIDVNGTVVSAKGLTVTSLAAVDPRVQFESMRAMMPGMEIGDTDYKEVKLRLADGTEVPGRLVLKDNDLDLAFIAPDAAEGSRTFTPVKLEDATEGHLLDTFYVVARAPKTLQRVPLVRPVLVNGIVEKPRRLYLMNDQLLGCPVFDAAGHVLGIALQNLSGGRSAGLVVLPAADIAEVAKQAAAAQATLPPPKPAPAEVAPAPAQPKQP